MLNDNILIEDVQTYLKVVFQLQYLYPPITSYSIYDNFIYRGVSSEIYDLIPSLYRKREGSEEPVYAYYQVSKENPNDYIVIIPTEKLNFEKYILDDFQREALPYFEDKLEKNNISLMEIAQHYSVPTRLLDWTTSPLVALYFTCINNFDKDGKIWILNKYNYSKFSDKDGKWRKYKPNELADILLDGEANIEKPHFPILFMPNYIDRRMEAQQSCFMMWGKSPLRLNEVFEENNYMKIENIGVNAKINQSVIRDDNKFVAALKINKKKKLLILDQLRSLGIDDKALFPGLDGIGRAIKKKYKNTYLSVNETDYKRIISINNREDNNGKNENEN